MTPDELFAPLNLPPFKYKIIREKGMLKIWDIIRQRYIKLTPEESVRQHFVHWLINDLNYPSSLISNEIGIELNGTKRRCDSVVFNTKGVPSMIIEYKAPHIKITQSVFDQILHYNLVLQVPYLIISNGINHYCCLLNIHKREYTFLSSVPNFEIISRGFSE